MCTIVIHANIPAINKTLRFDVMMGLTRKTQNGGIDVTKTSNEQSITPDEYLANYVGKKIISTKPHESRVLSTVQ